jgi:hypothetical protein
MVLIFGLRKSSKYLRHDLTHLQIIIDNKIICRHSLLFDMVLQQTLATFKLPCFQRQNAEFMSRGGPCRLTSPLIECDWIGEAVSGGQKQAVFEQKLVT